MPTFLAAVLVSLLTGCAPAGMVRIPSGESPILFVATEEGTVATESGGRVQRRLGEVAVKIRRFLGRGQDPAVLDYRFVEESAAGQLLERARAKYGADAVTEVEADISWNGMFTTITVRGMAVASEEIPDAR
jgi:hypothetical protein